MTSDEKKQKTLVGTIVEHIEDVEDYYLAVQRLEENLPTIPLEEVERRLGLAD